jgi:signal transduction histidine kinase
MAKKKIKFPSHIDLEEKISTWAHDLRSPFNHVLGFTKIVLNGQSGPLSDLQMEDLKTVYHSSLRAMSLVNNLIEIARLQQGLKEINQDSVTIDSFLEKALAQWKKYNPDKQLPITTLLAPHNGHIMIDKTHTQSLLNGFISYLTSYADGTGNLKIEVSEESQILTFKLHLTEIVKRGNDEMSLEMYGAICKAYVDLLQGEIQKSEVEDSEAIIHFTVPVAHPS